MLGPQFFVDAQFSVVMDGGRSQFLRLRPIRPASSFQIGLQQFRGFALWLGMAGLGVIALYSLGKQSLDGEIRHCFETELNRNLTEAGLRCTVGSAKFFPGQGVVLQQLKIATIGAASTTVAAVDEIVLVSTSGVGDLLLKNLDVDSIDTRGVHLFVQRDAQGAWNIEPLLRSLLSKIECPGAAFKPVRLNDSSITIRLVTDNDSVAYVVRDIRCSASRPPNPTNESGPSTIAVRGSLAGNGINQVAFALDIDSRSCSWKASVGATGAQIDSHMLKVFSSSLPADLQASTTFRGSLDVQFQAHGRLDRPSVAGFQLDGKISDVSINDVRLPWSIREGQAEFRLTPDSAKAWNVTAQTDRGGFNLEYDQSGSLLGPSSWRVKGMGRRLMVDRRWLPILPASWQDQFKKWSPDGVFDLSFDVRGDRTGLEPTLVAELIDASFEFDRFPYRLEHCVGRLELRNKQLEIQMQSLEQDHIFHIGGTIQNPGANYSGYVDVALDGQIPIDAKLLRAIEAQPKMAAVVKQFNGTGKIGVKGRIGRESAAQEKTQQDFRVQLVDCSVRHDQFDYPFHNVNGLLRLRNDRVDVDNVTAVHGNGNVRCDGIWSKDEGLKLQFLARSVSLDDQLRAALQPESRQRWTEMRPRGVVDLVQVHMVQLPSGGKVSVTVDAQVFPGGEQSETSVSIQPSWFPFAIHNVVGRMSIGDTTIDLQSIRGQHDQTWLSCNGRGTFDDDRWELRLTDLYVSGLEATDQLLSALPAKVGQAIKRVHWRGMVNARGEIVIAGQRRGPLAANGWGAAAYVSTTSLPHNTANPATPSLAWSLRLDTDDASCNVGFPLDHVCGGTAIEGTFDGQHFYCGGDIEIDSMMVGPSQINNIRGPIWIDPNHCAVGSLAAKTTDQQTPRSLSAEFYGGQLRVDGQMKLSDEQPFVVEAHFADCDMEALSDDLIPRHKNLFGQGYAAVRLSGDRSGKHSWRGEGQIQLRNARIEVPLMSAVGQVVRIPDFERTVFDESNVDFEVHGENLDLHQIEIIGSPISLIGNGQINHNREIDLDFYTVLGRNKIHIPVVSELYHASSQQFLHIKVDGDIDDPQTHKTVLPGINEPLRRLMEDLEKRAEQLEGGNLNVR